MRPPSLQAPKLHVEAATRTSLELRTAPGWAPSSRAASMGLFYGVKVGMSLIRGRDDGSREHEVGRGDMGGVVG